MTVVQSATNQGTFTAGSRSFLPPFSPSASPFLICLSVPSSLHACRRGLASFCVGGTLWPFYLSSSQRLDDFGPVAEVMLKPTVA